ncbi:transcription initiation factor TFIID subunit 4-like [Serinus canaria]|uniref:transcription initiation factor TFIID subunit 4-like n=1 Tax=Serinus canaria TaxID=9135 RepID=UPI0021CC714C|nr:transcription initiation factor TFIID subunit 4-like [Serinus canaria]
MAAALSLPPTPAPAPPLVPVPPAPPLTASCSRGAPATIDGSAHCSTARRRCQQGSAPPPAAAGAGHGGACAGLAGQALRAPQIGGCRVAARAWGAPPELSSPAQALLGLFGFGAGGSWAGAAPAIPEWVLGTSHMPSALSDRALPTRPTVSTKNRELKQFQVKIAAREACCGIEQIRSDLRTVEDSGITFTWLLFYGMSLTPAPSPPTDPTEPQCVCHSSRCSSGVRK